MTKSIMPNGDVRECYICKTTSNLERHHILGGPLRKISEREGFTVYLCHWHHNEPPMGIHHNRKAMDALRAECQREYEKSHTREEWMRLIGRNYL